MGARRLSKRWLAAFCLCARTENELCLQMVLGLRRAVRRDQQGNPNG